MREYRWQKSVLNFLKSRQNVPKFRGFFGAYEPLRMFDKRRDSEKEILCTGPHRYEA
jgi:hypothetical protein